jgi:hypothetical protein
MSRNNSNSKGKGAAPAAAARRTIFNVAEVRARAQGARDAKDGAFGWWDGVFTFGYGSVRAGNNNTAWFSVDYTDAAGDKGPLMLRVQKENHLGQIMPPTAAGVAELQAEIKNPKRVLKPREYGVSLQVTKYPGRVEVMADEITVKTDESGKPIYPDQTSDFYAVSALLTEAFVAEAQKRVKAGTSFISLVDRIREANSKATVDDVLKELGAVALNSIIISQEMKDGLKRYFKEKADLDRLTKNMYIATNCRIASRVQEYISEKNTKNGGLPMPNPMTRIDVKFHKDSGTAELEIFDGTKPFTAEGKKQFEKGKVNGVPVNADNVHKFIKSNSGFAGIIDASGGCFSSMGISNSVKVSILIVTPPPASKVSIDDFWEDDDNLGVTVSGDAPAAAAAGAAEAAAEAEQDYTDDQLLKEIQGLSA